MAAILQEHCGSLKSACSACSHAKLHHCQFVSCMQALMQRELKLESKTQVWPS